MQMEIKALHLQLSNKFHTYYTSRMCGEKLQKENTEEITQS